MIWTKIDLLSASNFSIFEFKAIQIWIFFLLFRSIVSFAQNLSSNKDVKEVFGQLVEKPIEAFKFKSMWATPATVALFLRAYGDVIKDNTVMVDSDLKCLIGKSYFKDEVYIRNGSLDRLVQITGSAPNNVAQAKVSNCSMYL